MAHLFFSSYAHANNRCVYLKRFIEQLRLEISQLCTGIDLNEIGFFDVDGIQTGEDWIKRLSSVVCSCKVCVAICSPHFFESEFCGKEIAVFLKRLQMWQSLEGNADGTGKAIIPVLWIGGDISPALKEYQHIDGDFPNEYKALGLRELYQFTRHREKRKQVVVALAKRVREAAKTDLPPHEVIPHFDYIDSAFRSDRGGVRYGIAVVALLKNGINADCFGQGRLVRSEVDFACSDRIPWRFLELDNTLEHRLRASRENREAIVVLVDLEIIRDSLYGNLIAAVDRNAGCQIVFLAVRGRGSFDSTDMDGAAEIALDSHFPSIFRGALYRDWQSIRSQADLRRILAESIHNLRNTLIEVDPIRKVVDHKTTAMALAEGVPTERQPLLSGPTGIGN